MTCLNHSHLRGDWRCPCDPPGGELGTAPAYRVNALLDHSGKLWLQNIHHGYWFPSMVPGAAEFVPAGEPYPVGTQTWETKR